jgi:3-oxoacyl-[acyl-carrier-protein] synthase II
MVAAVMVVGVGICGIGVTTGYGWGRDSLWSGLVSGVSAAVPVAGLGAGAAEKVTVARVPEGGEPTDGTTRFARAVRGTVREAVNDARARGWQPGPTVGIVYASVMHDVAGWRDLYRRDDERRIRPRAFLELMPSTPITLAAREFGFRGPTVTVGAMCASGNAALLTAQQWLAAGLVSDVVVVAADFSCVPEILQGFRDLGVAVTDAPALEACRPFQQGSRGFVMGEAAAAFVVSDRSQAPYGRLLGGAMSQDGHHVVSLAPDHEQVLRCVREAMAAAGVCGGDVAYLNAHGPGTAQCDDAELAVCEQLLGPATRVYSLKPLVGHCQSAASAVETAVTLLGHERQLVPVPFAVGAAHPRLLPGPEARRPGVTVKTSLGLGGHNSAIVLAEA